MSTGFICLDKVVHTQGIFKQNKNDIEAWETECRLSYTANNVQDIIPNKVFSLPQLSKSNDFHVSFM